MSTALHAIHARGITPEDQAREERITNCFNKMLDAVNVEDRSHWADELAREVNQRSPEMVAKLEKEMGLQ